MSDAVTAPAPTEATTTAQPAAVARTSATKKTDGEMSQKDAVDFLRKRRAARNGNDKIKLVPKQEPDNTATETTTDIPEASQPSAEASPAETEGTDESGTSQEKEPTWAQKLRVDLTKKTEAVKQLEQRDRERETRFKDAFQQATWAREDVEADLASERAYSQQLEQMIDGAGFSVPSHWKGQLAAERKLAAAERQLARGQQKLQGHGAEKAGEKAKTDLATLGNSIPEVKAAFAGNDPEMHAWLTERFAIENGKPTGLGMKNIEKDAAVFAKSLRFERSQRTQKPQTSTKPAESARPQSTTLAGQGAGAGQKRMPAIPQNEKESLAFLAARRAARK